MEIRTPLTVEPAASYMLEAAATSSAAVHMSSALYGKPIHLQFTWTFTGKSGISIMFTVSVFLTILREVRMVKRLLSTF